MQKEGNNTTNEPKTINKIYIMAGQSNMVGRGTPSEAVRDERYLPLKGTNFKWKNNAHLSDEETSKVWTKLQPQSHPEFGDYMGPETSLNINDGNNGANTWIIKYAMGSTSITKQWSIEENESSKFRDFVDFVKDAIEEVPEPRQVCCLFWLQGESDTKNAASSNGYGTNLKNFVAKVREELRESGLLFIPSKITWKSKHSVKLNASLETAITDLQPAILVDNEGFVTAEEKQGHLDTKSILELGKRYSEAYKALKKTEKTN